MFQLCATPGQDKFMNAWTDVFRYKGNHFGKLFAGEPAYGVEINKPVRKFTLINANLKYTLHAMETK